MKNYVSLMLPLIFIFGCNDNVGQKSDRNAVEQEINTEDVSVKFFVSSPDSSSVHLPFSQNWKAINSAFLFDPDLALNSDEKTTVSTGVSLSEINSSAYYIFADVAVAAGQKKVVYVNASAPDGTAVRLGLARHCSDSEFDGSFQEIELAPTPTVFEISHTFEADHNCFRFDVSNAATQSGSELVIWALEVLQ